MKRLIFFAGMMIWLILWVGCTSIPVKEESDAGGVKRSPISLPAEVFKVEGDLIVLRMECRPNSVII